MAVYDDQKEKLKPKADGSHDDLGVHPERREAEVDDLEKLYNAESAPEKKPGSSADEKEKANLGRAEKSSDSDKTESPDSPGSDWENKTGPGKKRRFKITGKQAAAGGAATGLLVGSSIGFFTFMAGPMQFLQFAKLLERFHFDSSKNFGNSRTSKLFRYARKQITGRPVNNEDFNLSRTGNKIAVHYEKKLASQGVEMGYDNSGRLTSMSINPDSPAGKKMLDGLETDNGVAMPKDRDGRVRLEFAPNSEEITSKGVRRKMVKGAVNAMDMNGVSSSMAKRMLKARARVDFHPLKNLADDFDEKLGLKWKEWKEKVQEERTKRIDEGTDPPKAKTSTTGEDPDNPSNVDDQDTKVKLDDSVADIADEAANPKATFNERVSGVRGKLTAGVGVAGIVATICGLDALGDSVGELQEQNIVQPLIRSGMDIITVASQIQSGQDVSMAEIGAIAESFHDAGNPETGQAPSSWMSAESIQAELGKPGTGVKMPDSAKPGKDRPKFFEILDSLTSLPGISSICSATNSTLGGLALSVGGIVASATGVGAFALAGVSEVAQNFIAGAFVDDLVRFLAGPALTLAGAAGGELGNYANFGAFLANNNTAKGWGGRALTNRERVALANERDDMIRQENKQKKFYARMFDVTSPDSLVSKSVIQNNSIYNAQTGFASLIRSPFQAFSGLGSSLASLNPKARAETTPYDYGVDEYGFSIGERDSEDLADPYANAEIVEPQLDELNSKYGEKCFGTTVDKSSGKVKFGRAPMYDDLEKNKDTCGDGNKDEMFLRYRMYIADTVNAASITCYESIDEAACQELGLENTSSANNNPTTPTLNGVECPANMTETKQVGSSTYYKLPDAPGGEYTIYSRDARRYGQRELICVLYTVSKAYKSMYGAQSTVSIGDLNAAGHKSHKWGVAVDLDAQGEIVAADNQNGGSKYSTEATIALGKLFVDTGYIKNIWYCSNDGAADAIRGYAVSVGKPITIKCLTGHYNHFHVDINTPRGAEDTP